MKLFIFQFLEDFDLWLSRSGHQMVTLFLIYTEPISTKSPHTTEPLPSPSLDETLFCFGQTNPFRTPFAILTGSHFCSGSISSSLLCCVRVAAAVQLEYLIARCVHFNQILPYCIWVISFLCRTILSRSLPEERWVLVKLESDRLTCRLKRWCHSGEVMLCVVFTLQHGARLGGFSRTLCVKSM
jgi:hypothetical protein